jgi:hypothetical protein
LLRPAESHHQRPVAAVLSEFSARLQKGDNGAWTYANMDRSAEFFGTHGLVKVRGTIDGQPSKSAFMALRDGTHQLPVKAETRKAIGKAAGDIVVVHVGSGGRWGRDVAVGRGW